MGRWEDEAVDLIYLDPPFKSERNYNQIFPLGADEAGDAQYRAFEDIWYWDEAAETRLNNLMRHHVCEDVIGAFEKICPRSRMLSYLTYMAQRLDRCYDILKSTGSIYLHCDPTASHYLKILMDVIFTKNKKGGGISK